MMTTLPLSPEKAFVFRVVHRENLPWILKHGLHCQTSQVVDPNYVDIGNPDLIGRRRSRPVPIPPGGTFSDYVPFYFTPRSPMLLNIKTGWNGIKQRSNDEIVILVTSLYRILNLNLPFIFTDRHANVQTARFFSDLARLDTIDWAILQRSDFKRDLDDLGKLERYQAEALVYHHIPAACLLGLACDSPASVDRITTQLQMSKVALRVIARPGWYF